MTATKPGLLTVEEFARLDAVGDRYELIEGELVKMPGSGFNHSAIAVAIAAELRAHVRRHHLGRVTGADGGYIFSRNPDTVLIPDVAFVRAERLPPRSEQAGFLAVVPDLVVEVVSPHDRLGDVASKVARYLRAGVATVWVVDPSVMTISVHVGEQAARLLGVDDTLDGGDLIPGFRIPVVELFDL
jgi:Uma2 family endonuclease